jgi:hypothetical protein
MKTRLYPAFGLAALCAVGLGTSASANIFSDNIDMLVVAEQMPPAATAPQGPTSYIAFDGGYIEAGDAIAGDSAPTPAQVRDALQSALSQNGFQSVAASPTLVLAYYWGVLRVDHRQIKPPYEIKKNLMARIELVSTQELGAEVENHILGREKGSGMDTNASAPPILAGPLETIRQDAKQPRIFIVVSAYDYQALTHNEAKLVWQTKLSALETSGDMETVIPSLIAGGGKFFGKSIPNMRDVYVPGSRPAPQAVSTAYAPPAPESLQLDKRFFEHLLKQENQKVSGENF